MLFGDPSCRPWSVASANKDPVLRAEGHNQEAPEFLRDCMLWQRNQGRPFCAEQPYGSDVFKKSPMSRPFSRTSSVVTSGSMHAWCARRTGTTCPQPTGFLATGLGRKFASAVMVTVHRGRPMVFFKVGVMAAIVYSSRCSLSEATLPSVRSGSLAHSLSGWGDLTQAMAAHAVLAPQCLYYSCQRCQLGRARPAHIEHTFEPGSCRMRQPSMRGIRSKSAPRDARPQISDLEDPTRNGDYSKAILARDPAIFLSADHALLLKAALVQLVESCVSVFSEATGVDYDRWLDDPVLFRVLGVTCSLRPWQRKIPDSRSSTFFFLRSSSIAHSWQSSTLARSGSGGHAPNMSQSQLHAKVELIGAFTCLVMRKMILLLIVPKILLSLPLLVLPRFRSKRKMGEILPPQQNLLRQAILPRLL